MTAKTLKTLFAAGLTAGLIATAAPAAHAETHAINGPGTQETSHFRVTAEWTGVKDNLATAAVEVCAKVPAGDPDVRVSWDPWSMNYVNDAVHRAGAYEGGTDVADFPYGDGAPLDNPVRTVRYLHDGECARGTIAFTREPGSMARTVVYHNGYDETLIWGLDG